MVTKTLTLMTDDIDGTPASQTIVFAVDEVIVEIDLSDDNAKVFRAFMETYIQAGTLKRGRVALFDRQILPQARRPALVTTRRMPARLKPIDDVRPVLDEPQKIRYRKVRNWAVAKGYDVSARGAIAAPIMKEYLRTFSALLEEQRNNARAKKAVPPAKAAPAPRKTARGRAQTAAPEEAPQKPAAKPAAAKRVSKPLTRGGVKKPGKPVPAAKFISN